MPLTTSRKLVLKKLHDCFPDSGLANDALHSLEHYQGKDTDLVHLAALKLSGGQLWRLRECVRLANKKDGRDVVIEARYPQSVAHTQKVLPNLMRGIRPKNRSVSKIKNLKKQDDDRRRRDEEQWQLWLKSDRG